MARTKKSRKAKASKNKKPKSALPTKAIIEPLDESQDGSDPSTSNAMGMTGLYHAKDPELETSARPDTAASLPRVLDYKNLLSKDCVLYRFAPEIRKKIFKAVLELLFREFSGRKELRYDLDMYGRQYIQPSSPYGFQRIPGQDSIIFAGLWHELLPALEWALFADAKLHNEFIAARVEESIIVLKPEIVSDYQLGYGYDYVAWPQVNKISPKVRSLLRSLTFALEVNYSWDHQIANLEGDQVEEMEAEGWGRSDEYQRMRRLAKEIAKLLPEVLPAPETIEAPASSQPPKSGCELLPLLEKLVIRFPNASREGLGQSYKLFLKKGTPFLKSLKKFIKATHIKTFQLEDLRDFKQEHKPEFGERKPLGLMEDDGARFRKLTTFLNKVFGFISEDETGIHQEDIGDRGKGWEIYRAKETWTTDEMFLVWNS